MSAVKKQRIDLRLTDDDKSMIEEAAAISNQSVSQFMLNSASQRALSNPPSPGEKLKRAAKRLQGM